MQLTATRTLDVLEDAVERGALHPAATRPFHCFRVIILVGHTVLLVRKVPRPKEVVLAIRIQLAFPVLPHPDLVAGAELRVVQHLLDL